MDNEEFLVRKISNLKDQHSKSIEAEMINRRAYASSSVLRPIQEKQRNLKTEIEKLEAQLNELTARK